jgi:hypothetical protein
MIAVRWPARVKDRKERAMNRTYRLSGPALVAISGTVMAGEVPKFEELDRDGDGYLSREEAAGVPGLLEHFSVFDLDGDGLLSRSEYSVVEGQIGGPHDETI